MSRRGRWAIRTALGLGTFFLVACLGIIIGGLWDDPHKADLCVVLGNAVHPDGTPSKHLQVRLDHAVKLYQAGYFTTILVSGATGREGYSEPAAMRHYLEQAGIPSASIFEDSGGRDTFHTAQDTRAFMREHHFTSVLIVSQYFHLVRCRLAFSRFGISPIYTSHAPYFSWRDFYSVPREVAGCFQYALRRY